MSKMIKALGLNEEVKIYISETTSVVNEAIKNTTYGLVLLVC